MNNQKDINWDLLARYFAGNLPPKEKENMDHWINGNPDRRKNIEKLHRIWVKAGYPEGKIDVDDAWLKLVAEMQDVDAERKKKPLTVLPRRKKTTTRLSGLSSQRQIRTDYTRLAYFAFAAAVAIMISVISVLMFQNETELELLSSSVVYNTEKGERATIRLIDGTRVTLHPGSKLEVYQDYNVNTRELHLNGEAYFEVEPVSNKPFILYSNETFTEVLGTSFLVKSWDELEHVIIVTKGRVKFGDILHSRGQSKQVNLGENQMAYMSKEQGPVVEEVDNMNWYLGWMDGYLVFDNRPLGEVVSRLERWYDVEIHLEDTSMEDLNISAELEYHQNLYEVLRAMTMALDLDFNTKEGVVQIRYQANS